MQKINTLLQLKPVPAKAPRATERGDLLD
jgi:hypothetical protein